jgi:hypothetical protein
MMRDMDPRLHRYAIFLALIALAVIVSGAFITSTEVAARQSQAPIPGGGLDRVLHRALAIALTLLTLGIAIWTSVVPTSGWLRAVGCTGVATLVIDAALGGRLRRFPPVSESGTLCWLISSSPSWS